MGCGRGEIIGDLGGFIRTLILLCVRLEALGVPLSRGSAYLTWVFT